MTSISSRTAPATIAPLAGLIRRIGIWGNLLVAYFVRRAAIKALQQLDDRGLRDLGLSRCQIETAVSGLANTESELGRLR